MQLFGELRVDFYIDRPFRANSALDFATNLRRRAVKARPPDRQRPPAADPIGKAGIPRIVVREPPVAGAITPIPRSRRIPRIRVAAAEDFVFDFGLSDR